MTTAGSVRRVALAGAVALTATVAPHAQPPAVAVVSATEKVATGPRTATIDAGYGRKFAVDNVRPRVTVSNPYLELQRPLFDGRLKLACTADGGLIVTGRGGFTPDGRTVAAGTWTVAPDGAVVPKATRPTSGGGAAPLPPRVLEDTDGNRWSTDEKGCALRRTTPAGETTTVLGAEVLCAEAVPTEDRPLLDVLAWDAVHGEVVSGGSRTVARPVHDLYTTVWRIAPSGAFRRVLFGKKATRISPATHHLDGVSALAVDPKGRIFIISRLMLFERRGWDELQLLRLDEAGATVVEASGAKIPRGTWMAEHPLDGPLDRAVFNYSHDMCFAPDGTLFVSDDIFVRKVDTAGQVTTWLF